MYLTKDKSGKLGCQGDGNIVNNYDEIYVETKYLINDSAQAKALGNAKLQYQDFDTHWMVITKYYKDNNTGQKAVAIAAWD